MNSCLDGRALWTLFLVEVAVSLHGVQENNLILRWYLEYVINYVF